MTIDITDFEGTLEKIIESTKRAVNLYLKVMEVNADTLVALSTLHDKPLPPYYKEKLTEIFDKIYKE